MKRRINIYHISPYPYHSGGIDTWLHQFLTEFQNIFDIIVYCPKPKDVSIRPMFDTTPLGNVKITYIPQAKNEFLSRSRILKLYYYYKIMKRSETCDSDINLVLSTYPVGFIIYILKKIRVIQGELLMSVRGCVAKDMSDIKKSLFVQKIFFILEKYSMRASDQLIANGWDTQSYIKKFYGINSIVIPNFISPSASLEVNTNKYNQLKNKKVKIITHIGTLRHIKNINELINAVEIYHQKYNQDYLLIFGGKGNIEYYKTVAMSKKINALFLGELKHQDVSSLLDISDVILNSSFGCGVSNSLLETLALGKIVVSPNKKTFSQVIEHKKNGYLYAYQNTEDHALKIHEAARNIYSINKYCISESIKQFHVINVKKSWLRLLK